MPCQGDRRSDCGLFPAAGGLGLADFIISGYVSLGPRPEPHHRAARPARSFCVRPRPDRPHAAQPAPVFGSNRHPDVEAAIISTCNRTEIYCAADQAALDHTVDWLAHSGGVAPALLRSHAYTLHDDHAARHAFRVASGLDSMVLGEPQILGQMKDAVRAAETAGALGSTLNQLFQRSFAVAKEVRTATEIGAHSISMAAAAVRLAGQLFEDLQRHPRAVRRRRRDDRPGGHPLRRHASPKPSPSPTARWNAAKSWPRASAARPCGWPTCRRGWPSSTSS